MELTEDKTHFPLLSSPLRSNLSEGSSRLGHGGLLLFPRACVEMPALCRRFPVNCQSCAEQMILTDLRSVLFE